MSEFSDLGMGRIRIVEARKHGKSNSKISGNSQFSISPLSGP